MLEFNNQYVRMCLCVSPLCVYFFDELSYPVIPIKSSSQQII